MNSSDSQDDSDGYDYDCEGIGGVNGIYFMKYFRMYQVRFP